MRVIAGVALAAGMVSSDGSMGCSEPATPMMDVSGDLALEVTPTDDGLEVTALFVDDPAFAQLRLGDHIVAVDQESLAPLSVEERVQRLLGPVGSEAHLAVDRDARPLDATVPRRPVPRGTHGRFSAVVDGHFDACGVQASFDILFETGPAGRVEHRIRGRQPTDDVLDCALDAIGALEIDAVGTVRVRVMPRPVYGWADWEE